ncbi:uncharacterized protein LOC131047412 [Cryptomeria japonica]|uniref:uncharacterized protein LOC131047412 n=1 Tax=Cryptomeria japonica TaxID=3369 RepID=UPI0027DAA18B|nr:uncharacterized protein LOC131047412 [Cryptomeria japonica]
MEKWWNQCNYIKGTPSFCFTKKFAHTKNQLKIWNKEVFKNIFSEKESIEAELETLNSKVMNNGMDDFRKEKELKAMLSEILTREEIYWKDKAKELWIKEADKNTIFFHASVKARRAQNIINEISSEDGICRKDRDSISQASVAHFKEILNSNERREELCSTKLLEAIPKMVTDRDNQMLLEPFTEDEVRKAVFGLHPDKAPGPDGMTARLKKVLPKLISSEQNGFTPGREIIDSIILTSKTIHSIIGDRRKAMVIKLDISKAFDKVRWEFLMEFANDTTLFGEATIREARVIQDSLELYANAAGWSIGSLPTKYLGVPLIVGLAKPEVREDLISKCRQKTEACKHKWLALPGRIQLIKVVLSAMPIYAMSVFKLSSKAIQALESFFKRFLWDGAKQIKKIPLIGWDIVCCSKEDGRAGLRRLEIQNLALGAKLIWKIYHSPEKLWCTIMRKKYLDNEDPTKILMAIGAKGGSALWRFIKECRHIITDHLSWKIGDGKRARFWDDSWDGHESLCKLFEGSDWINEA